MATVLRDLWDFDDPAGSEQRFRALADEADEPLASRTLTQVARALGLQERYAEGHAVLDGLSPTDPDARVRVALERGRLLRSSGDEAAARAHFEEAAAAARSAGLEELEVDALHMVALVVAPGRPAGSARGRTRAGPVRERPRRTGLGRLPAQQHRHDVRGRR
ncbi:hypothetical protein NOCA1240259 [metagenome]|uniref:Uncharacterized protein n=1 Tax=metagenome TaxID=256318 RepID=A0A2P2CGM9_9ZZZZ